MRKADVIGKKEMVERENEKKEMQRKKKCKAFIPYLSKRNDVMKKFYTQTHTSSRAICIVTVVFNF